MNRFASFATALLLAPFSALAADVPPAGAKATANPEHIAFYEKEVRPLLEAHCFKCHGGEAKIKGGLRLTNRADLLKGGDTGPGIDVAALDKSLLIDAINYRNDLEMPPKEKLPADKIAVLTKWVQMGAPYPANAQTAAAGHAEEHKAPTLEAAKAHWAFQPVKRPATPGVQDKAWVRNAIDAFVLARLEAKGLKPAPQADKATLIRRAYYDLTGLPPTPAEVQAFVADASPDAYEKLIDRLLASPHYGEKWGRHWLDLVRYGETNSYERDNPKPNVWRYRDYVIRAFNDDKPYDRFIKEQLAGDEMPEAKTESDPLIATGYYRLGIWDDEPTDRLLAKYDGLDDIVATTGQVMLGLTVDCARCHDHKIDYIPQKDYYQFISFFQNINHYSNGGPNDEAIIAATPGEREAAQRRAKERQERIEMAEESIREVEREFHQLLQGEPGKSQIAREDAKKLMKSEGARVLGQARFDRYQQLLKDLESLKPRRGGREDVDKALVVTEAGSKPPVTYVWIRGNAGVQGPQVEPGFLDALGDAKPVIPQPAAGQKTTGRRTVLANWITSAENPLTARVMANRLFQYHFGRGIVRSGNDFGFQGDKPTHPDLLDWLASEFVSQGWRMKAMHKLIMTSSAYRMSSRADEKALAADPRNDLLWRFDMRRLTAEEIRDSILAANGTLNLKMAGPSIYPPIPKEVMAGQSRPGSGWNTSPPQEAARRSVYIHVKRSLREPLLEAFDAAEPDKSCPVRFVTVQPTQALGMLNSEFMSQEAQKLADRLKKEAGDDRTKQVTLALSLINSRRPGADEVDRGVKLIEDLIRQDGASPDLALRYFCLMALNLNEFVYLD